MKNISKILVLFLSFLVSCSQDSEGIDKEEEKPEITKESISAVDISNYPQISETDIVFYNKNGQAEDLLEILKTNGVNTIRLRLWVNPATTHSGMNEVEQFSKTLKSKGFKIWLTVHYSDTWADPGQQQIPSQWQSADYADLKELVEDYTQEVMSRIRPDYIQIGNEINSGFLFPFGNINENFGQFQELMAVASKMVRSSSSETKIILHFAGINGADWFFDSVKEVDYDMIGISFYPIWHGKSLSRLENLLINLSATYDKPAVIAETAYPFTLEWNDWTNNIVGEEDQLILPDYPATPAGQKNFMEGINKMVENSEDIVGFCYWGAELVAWNGEESTEGSPWENQALFDFQNKALPVLEAFSVE